MDGKYTYEKLLEMAFSGKADICCDSRKIKESDIFVAVKGTDFDGYEYAEEAFSKGAQAIVCSADRPVCRGIPEGRTIKVENTRKALAELSGARYRDPSSELDIYGVTGTNGKSTTVWLIHSILSEAGIPCGMTGTVFNNVEDDKMEKAGITTPGTLELNRMLRKMADNGKKAVSMEVSSHALLQERIHGIALRGVVFTNISPEHLDYHKDMDSYLEAKLRIFGYLVPEGISVLNADDDAVVSVGRRISLSDPVTFGFSSSATVSAANVDLKPGFTEFNIIYKGEDAGRVRTLLIGKHNVSNILAASAMLLSAGISTDTLIEAINKTRPVPGRMENLEIDMPFMVFVDYAHTPDALKNSLECLRPLTQGKLYCVFGCGGNRDTVKRPEMGKISSELADVTIVTSDNPRFEDPLKIISDIKKGVSPGKEVSILEDRKEAIEYALTRAQEGDTILIAGKGHEDYQIQGKNIIHFDDKETVLSIVENISLKRG